MLCLLIWLGIGLAVPALVAQGRLPPLASPDDAAPAFLLGFAPEPLAGFAVAAILAAIMSTADSFMNLGAAVFVRDLPERFGRRVENELLWGRIATVGVDARRGRPALCLQRPHRAARAPSPSAPSAPPWRRPWPWGSTGSG